MKDELDRVANDLTETTVEATVADKYVEVSMRGGYWVVYVTDEGDKYVEAVHNDFYNEVEIDDRCEIRVIKNESSVFDIEVQLLDDGKSREKLSRGCFDTMYDLADFVGIPANKFSIHWM